MTYPSVLSPWYVVRRHQTLIDDCVMEYYTAMEEGEGDFTPDQKRALLFMNLIHAARIATAEGAEILVLTSKEDAEAYGRS